jgi:purine-binding chemotaxis protein CheW
MHSGEDPTGTEAAMSVATTDHKHVVLTLGREEYAVPVARVREIVRWTEPRPLPEQPGWVEGALDLRGDVVTVVDLRRRFGGAGGGGTGDGGGERDVVVLDLGDDRCMGLTVDGVREVVDVDPSQYRPTPAGIDCGDYVEGVIMLGDRLVVRLDVGAL